MNDRKLQEKRLIAAAIDIGVGFALAIVLFMGFGLLGWLLGMVAGVDSAVTLYVPRLLNVVAAVLFLGYLLGRDLLGNGRSLGKKTQEIRVVTSSGQPIGPLESVKRNAIFAIGSLLAAGSAVLQLVPCLGDAVACLISPLIFLGGLVSIAAAVVEIIKITQDPAGVRLGDQLAGTRVVQ